MIAANSKPKSKPCELCKGPAGFFPLKPLLLDGVFYDACRGCWEENKHKSLQLKRRYER